MKIEVFDDADLFTVKHYTVVSVPSPRDTLPSGEQHPAPPPHLRATIGGNTLLALRTLRPRDSLPA